MSSKQPKARRRTLGRFQATPVRPKQPRETQRDSKAKWGWSPAKIAQLNEVIESYGGDPDGFWKQQSHSYEAVVARRSLSELERFYSLLFSPGKTYEEIRKNCPRWPKDSKQAGALPSDSVLSEIRYRFATEKTLGSSGYVMQFLEKFKAKATHAGSQEILDSVMRLISDEVVAAKLSGLPVSHQLKAVDRLLKREGQRISWAKVKSWLDDQITQAIKALCEEAKNDPVAVEYLKKVEERIRDIHAKAESSAT